MKEYWITASEIVKRQLPGLPTSRRGVEYKAKAENWSFRSKQGKGGGKEYALSALPKEAQGAYEAFSPPPPLSGEKWHDFNVAADQKVEKQVSVDEIKQALLMRLEEVLSHLLPNGRMCGEVFQVGDVRNGQGKSLKVELNSGKAGLWHDFATGEGGDILHLWAICKGLDVSTQFSQVLESAKEWLGYSVYNRKVETKRKRWAYCDTEGQVLATVYRQETKEGKRFFVQDARTLEYKAPTPRPLYNQQGIKASKQVVLVEGEKCADALIGQGICATTAMGGSGASMEKTDWSPLQDKDVVIWPDNDVCGRGFAKKVSEYLKGKEVASVVILSVPVGKAEKWDAADAVEEGFDIKTFLESAQIARDVPAIPYYFREDYLTDRSAMPADLIAPRVLTPEGLLVFGGAPKVGKSDFLIALLSHMAAGISFLNMKPMRPLRVFYLQMEIGYHYLRERLQSKVYDTDALLPANKNLVITPQATMLLNEEGVKMVTATIRQCFPKEPVDIIAIDPLRCVFDGGSQESSENDNTAMMFFLQNRLGDLRRGVNAKAGIILTHHTRKMVKKQFEEEPFQAFSGASALRAFYTTGMVLFRPDEERAERVLSFELRNGEAIDTKFVHKQSGKWFELDKREVRFSGQKQGEKQDTERVRKHDVIVHILLEEARKGRIYTLNQFGEVFEGGNGLGSKDSIRRRLDVLCTNGEVKFIREAISGLKTPRRSSSGFLCVKNMRLGLMESVYHPKTGEKIGLYQSLYPTHFKCSSTGALLPVEDRKQWVERKKN